MICQVTGREGGEGQVTSTTRCSEEESLVSNNNNRSWRLHCHRPSQPSARITSNEGWIPCQITACGDDRVELINRLPFPQPPLIQFSYTSFWPISNITAKSKGVRLSLFLSQLSPQMFTERRGFSSLAREQKWDGKYF